MFSFPLREKYIILGPTSRVMPTDALPFSRNTHLPKLPYSRCEILILIKTPLLRLIILLSQLYLFSKKYSTQLLCCKSHKLLYKKSPVFCYVFRQIKKILEIFLILCYSYSCGIPHREKEKTKNVLGRRDGSKEGESYDRSS